MSHKNCRPASDPPSPGSTDGSSSTSSPSNSLTNSLDHLHAPEELAEDIAFLGGFFSDSSSRRQPKDALLKKVWIANNGPPSKVAHPHPIHHLTLFANNSPPQNTRGPLSVRRKQGYYSQTRFIVSPDGRGLFYTWAIIRIARKRPGRRRSRTRRLRCATGPPARSG